ncbi:MAG: radical SAM protein [Dehalococcoidales bacterium]|nr:radical SAM protein [Dehalococcoidales bacterium]
MACVHYGEEPVVSGTNGSGTVFFGNCNLRCVYCQNYQISQDGKSQRTKEIDPQALAERMLYLQNELCCHNINFVSPSHFIPQLVRALLTAVPMGLHLPLVYNTNSYDSIKSLRELKGVIGVYLADLRYASDKWGQRFSRVSDYVSQARAAIQEMYWQVGDLVVDDEGIAWKGLIVRHLILPNRLAGSRDSLSWLVSEVSPAVAVSIMSQYYPAHRARRIPLLARQILSSEYAEVMALLEELEMENGWVQEMGVAESYLPDFIGKSHPFDTVVGSRR